MNRIRRMGSFAMLALWPAIAMMAPAFAEPPASATSQPTSRPSVDQDLVKRLLGGQSSTLDTVESTLAEMEKVKSRLTENLDVGPQTQQAQRRIVDGIDQLIEQAKRNRSSGNSQQVARRPAEPKPDNRPQQRSAQKSDAPDPGKATKGGAGAPQGEKRDAAARSGDKAELARGWGFLPLRDRQEISQGFDEEFIGKYREAIIRYYRDLAKTAEKNK